MDVITSADDDPQPTARKVRPVKRKPREDEIAATELEGEGQPAPRAPRIPLRSDPVVTLFFICLGVGLAITLLALSQNKVLRQIGLIGPCFATLAYPIIGLTRGIATRPAARERFADNCYYLGFIFTQAALFLAFAPSTFFERSLQSRDVLGFFGMALSAALAGLITRTILVQLGSSLPEVEDAVHQEVEEVARQVAERSRAIVAEFQSMANAAEAVTSSMSSGLDQLTGALGRFDDVVRQELASFERGAGAVEIALGATKDSVDLQQQAFGEHVREAAEALRQLQSTLSSRTEEAMASLKDATTALQSGSNALSAFTDLTPRMDVLHTQLSKVEQLAGDLDTLSARVSEGVEGSATNIAAELHASAAAASGRIASAADQSAGELQSAASRAASDLRNRALAFDQDLAATTERLSDALRGFREELARLNTERDGGGA